MTVTNHEINEAVARKLGWIDIQPSSNPKIFYGFRGDTDEMQLIPDYCTSIAAAWEIVEKQSMALVPFSSGRWYATTIDMPETENECFEIWTQSNCATENECSCGCCVVADTAPMAICLAFLKLEDK
jgi:hypothetical protein